MSVLPTTWLRTSRFVVEPHVPPMETSPTIAAAAAPCRVGGSAMPVAAAPGGELLRLGGVVPSAPPHPPRAGVLVLFPRRRRRARLPDRIRPLNPAIGRRSNPTVSSHLGDKLKRSIEQSEGLFTWAAVALSPGTCAGVASFCFEKPRVASMRCQLS